MIAKTKKQQKRAPKGQESRTRKTKTSAKFEDSTVISSKHCYSALLNHKYHQQRQNFIQEKQGQTGIACCCAGSTENSDPKRKLFFVQIVVRFSLFG